MRGTTGASCAWSLANLASAFRKTLLAASGNGRDCRGSDVTPNTYALDGDDQILAEG